MDSDVLGLCPFICLIAIREWPDGIAEMVLCSSSLSVAIGGVAIGGIAEAKQIRARIRITN